MNAYAQAKHIFWKEYRAQRSIWLGIIAIIIVLQFLTIAYKPPGLTNPIETLIGVGSILTAFYALASVSVLFSGEREEETVNWLMTLPVSKRSLFGGKIVWVLASWLAGIAVTSLTAYLPYGGTEWNSKIALNLFFGLLRYGGSMFAWGLLFSLLCKRVYSAIACATVAFILSGSMIQFMAGMMDILTVTALLGSVVVGRHWLSNDRIVALPQFAIWADRFNLERALANSIESSPGWKMFRRELWLEWRNARWMALAIFSAFLAITFTSIYTAPHFSQTTIAVLAYALLPLTLGFCTCRGEQYRETYRFQSNVGSSPLAVWSSKHLVWGSLLVLMTSIFSLPFLAMVNPVRNQWPLDNLRRELFNTLPLPENSLPYLLQQLYQDSIWQMVSFWLATICFMYAIGHICSLLVKRSISSLLVAVAVGTVLSVHLYATLLLDVPLSIAVGLPVVAFLLFTAWRTSGWLQEENSLRDWLRTFAVLTLFLTVCAASWTMWRMYEITYQPFYTGIMAFLPLLGLLTISVAGFFLTLLVLGGLLIAFRRKLTVSRLFVSLCLVHIASTAICMASVSSQVKPPEPSLIAAFTPTDEAVQTGNRYRELELLVSEKMPADIPQEQQPYEYWASFWKGNEEITAEQQEWLDANEPVLNKLITNTQHPNCAPENLFDINDWADHKYLMASSLDQLYPLLRLKALALEKEDQLSAAWKAHQALLNFHCHLSQNQTATLRTMNLDETRRYLQTDYVRWVNHPDQTIASLTQAASEFEECFNRFSSLESAFTLEAVHQQWAVDGNLLGIWGSGRNNVNDWPVYLDHLLHAKWPMEQERAMLMLQQIEEREIKLARHLTEGRTHQTQGEIVAGLDRIYDTLSNRWISMSHSWDSAIDESHEFWKLAATTPVIQATQTGQISGLPVQIDRPSRILSVELNWLRYQRLTYLSLALRIAELEGHADLTSLENLLTLKSELPNIEMTLDAGEKRFAQQSWTDYNLDADETWKTYLLYHDPVARGYFDLPQIKHFLERGNR
ncbi:MAG: ABC transporter permease [Planctomycetaceae bacterium]|nr:ABC transporter permease [Planctomycetaceae bacterium]